MADRGDARLRLHEDVPLFREAIAFTVAKTGFAGQVISLDFRATLHSREPMIQRSTAAS